MNSSRGRAFLSSKRRVDSVERANTAPSSTHVTRSPALRAERLIHRWALALEPHEKVSLYSWISRLLS
jgi:hypothetical protein